MDNKRQETLRERLEWYIYDCPYEEYNEQEVNYLIEQLQANADLENEIQSSYVSYIIKADIKERNLRTKKVVIASIATATIAASLFMMIFSNNESIAGLKNGIFNFIKNDESGVQFFVSPDNINTDVNSKPKTYTSSEIPEEIMKKIWKPLNDIGTFKLISVTTYNDGQMLAHFCKDEDIIDFCYNATSTGIIDDTPIVKKIWYQNILIICSELTFNYEIVRYRFRFEYAGGNYYIESNDIDNGELLLYGFIDFLLGE